MKICCGTDIIEIERIRQTLEDKKTGEAFKNRVYTKGEIDYCESKGMQKYQHYAARFAAKEAVFKAISETIENKYSINWKDIEITNDKNGKPQVKIQRIGPKGDLNLKKLKDLKNFKDLNSRDSGGLKNIGNIESIDLSISHCKEYAIASVAGLIG